MEKVHIPRPPHQEAMPGPPTGRRSTGEQIQASVRVARAPVPKSMSMDHVEQVTQSSLGADDVDPAVVLCHDTSRAVNVHVCRPQASKHWAPAQVSKQWAPMA